MSQPPRVETGTAGAPFGDVERCIAELEPRFGNRLTRNPDQRAHRAHTLTAVAPMMADAVIWPESEDDVVAIVKAAARHRVPLVGYGAGTSLEGHVNAVHGGITVDFSQMARVLAVRADDLDCTVEPGVTRAALQAELRDTGLFFPVDPGAEEATIGGMAATRASGTTTVGYGSMRENVVSLTVVTGLGDVVRTARRARKSASGLDLTRLFVGSEGTLGLFTSLTLRLYGVPAATAGGRIGFATVEAACQCAILAVQYGLRLARLELLDAAMMQCVATAGQLAVGVRPTLFFEIHGNEASCAAEAGILRDLAASCGGNDFEAALDETERRQLWKARHGAFWSVKTAHPGKTILVTDVAVPISRLAEAVTETVEDVRRLNLAAPIVGHVGDGNFHAIIAFDPMDEAEARRVTALTDRLATRAIALDGTITGEHGIGQGKQRFMAAEHGPALQPMAAIKAALDPLGIMNPGKMLPI